MIGNQLISFELNLPIIVARIWNLMRSKFSQKLAIAMSVYNRIISTNSL